MISSLKQATQPLPQRPQEPVRPTSPPRPDMLPLLRKQLQARYPILGEVNLISQKR